MATLATQRGDVLSDGAVVNSLRSPGACVNPAARGHFSVDFVAGAGDNLRTPGRGRRQNALKSKEVNAWQRSRDAEFLDQLMLDRSPEMRRNVGARERWLRALAGGVLIVLGLILPGAAGWFGGAAGVVLVLTAAVRY